MPKKIVLAYSGGLDTSIIIPWLKETYSCVIELPFLAEWLPSWQRKQPGKSVCPMLFGYFPQVTRISGKMFRS